MAVFISRGRWSRQPPGRVGVDYSNPISRDLVGAWVPTPAGYLDLSRYGNDGFTRNSGGPPILVGGPGNGSAFLFPTVGYFWRAGSTTPAAASAGVGFSAALWLRFPASPTTFGQHITRDAGSGTDWAIFGDTTTRRLAYGFNGGYLHTATNAVPAGEWHFWHLTIDASGNAVWYTDGVANGSAASVSVRTGTGAVRFNERSDGSSGNSDLGRVYLWNRGLSAAEARAMYANEWAVLRQQETPVFYSPSPTGVVLSAVTVTGITSTTATPRYTIDLP